MMRLHGVVVTQSPRLNNGGFGSGGNVMYRVARKERADQSFTETGLIVQAS